jgi:hypothetical protein
MGDYDKAIRTLSALCDQATDKRMEIELTGMIRRIIRLQDDAIMRSASLRTHAGTVLSTVPTTVLIAAE